MKKIYIATFILGTIAFLLYVTTDNFIRLLLVFICTYLSIKYLTKKEKIKDIKIFLICFICWCFLVFLDVAVFLFTSFLFNNDMESNKISMFKNVFANCIMMVTYIMTFMNKKVVTFCRHISEFSSHKNKFYMFLLVALSILLFSVMFYCCYFNVDGIITLSITFVSVLIYTFIIFKIIKEMEKSLKLRTEYELLLTNLSEYENLLDRQRILNHENKNQLLVIKGMINKNENAADYIDTLVDTQYKDNELLIMKTNRIPSGGLKGLIYYKMLNMKDKKINISLEVNRNINDIDFSKIPISTNQELCKIVGVFLDNAMQEVEVIKEKIVSIVIEKVNNNLVIRISNNYSNKDVNRIGEKGYTTKGNGHGYGLRLVKNIIENNNCFEHITEINGKLFTQIIRLKIKD